MAIYPFVIVLVVVITILLRSESAIARGIGLTLLLGAISLSIILVAAYDGPLVVVLMVYLGLLIFLLPIYGMYRAARDEMWPWFWAILGTTFLGLGLIFAVVYLRRYRPRPEMELRCGDCDAIVSDSAKFCPGCGVAIDEDPCPSCGANTSKGAKFCDECGHNLPEVEGGTSEINVQVCQFCGANLGVGEQGNICPACMKVRGY